MFQKSNGAGNERDGINKDQSGIEDKIEDEKLEITIDDQPDDFDPNAVRAGICSCSTKPLGSLEAKLRPKSEAPTTGFIKPASPSTHLYYTGLSAVSETPGGTAL